MYSQESCALLRRVWGHLERLWSPPPGPATGLNVPLNVGRLELEIFKLVLRNYMVDAYKLPRWLITGDTESLDMCR